MAGSGCNGVPLTVQLSSSWAGNDGNWSAFSISVGTPPQNFAVFPTIAGGETWVPVSQGCPSTSDALACAASRGVGANNGSQSSGFRTNASSTWDQLGLYQLTSEDDLFGSSDAGLYGTDTVTLGQDAGQNFTIPHQIVAGISTPDFWLGTVGLGILSSSFVGLSTDVPTLLSSMKSLNLTPSLSFGYSAGASYSSSTGNLVFGGFDPSLFESDTLEFGTNGTDDRALMVNVPSIVVTNTLEGTISMPIDVGGLPLALDSSVSQLWLPQPICDQFADALGLIYDNNTDLYLFNLTTRDQLINANPQFTFTLASGDQTTNIVFPFSAFDLQIGYPIYGNNTPYFPLKRAANDSQYVLGRAFLQEAYLAVDWERQNFSIGQTSHQSGLPQNLATICPLVASASFKSNSHNQLSAGAIAGIVVGVVLGVGLIAAAAWFTWRWQQKRRLARASNPAVSELDGAGRAKAELMSSEVHELQETGSEHQLMSTPIYELPGDSTLVELADREKQ